MSEYIRVPYSRNAVKTKLPLMASSASLVRCFARTLMEGSDEVVVKKFDELGWDAGEILWFLKSLGSGS